MRTIDFFSKIFIINLPERTDRLQHMERELLKINMPLEADKIEVFPAIRPKDKEPFHNLGCKGCFMSHLTLLKKARDSQLEKVLILEDDASFLPNFLKFEQDIVRQMKESSWDLIQFGYFPSSTDPDAQKLTNEKIKTMSLNQFSGEVRGTPCVAVNGQGLDRLINFLETLLARPLDHPSGGPMPIDGAYNIYSQLPESSRLLLVPPIVGQISSRSDISPKWHDQYPVLQPILAGLRNLGLTSLIRRK